jgi:hypothetical protein
MKPANEDRRAMADEHYEEIGKSLAALVVDAGMTTGKAWALLGGIGLYRRWMLSLWVERYREENPARARPGRRRKNSRAERKGLIDDLRNQRG